MRSEKRQVSPPYARNFLEYGVSKTAAHSGGRIHCGAFSSSVSDLRFGQFGRDCGGGLFGGFEAAVGAVGLGDGEVAGGGVAGGEFAQGWFFVGAEFLGFPAAGAEAAAGGWVDG